MTNRSDLSGKYAIITGSTQGLGEANGPLICRARGGLITCGRNAERGQELAAEMSATGCDVRFVPAELARVEDCRRIVAAADKSLGAGPQPIPPAEEES